MAQLQEKFRKDCAYHIRAANESEIRSEDSPEYIGATLFEYGIRYGAVLQDLDAVMPFFKASHLAFDLALSKPAKAQPEETVHSVLYLRFLTNFGFFASSELLNRHEQPADTAKLEVAVAALQMAFTDRILDDARKNPARRAAPPWSPRRASARQFPPRVSRRHQSGPV